MNAASEAAAEKNLDTRIANLKRGGWQLRRVYTLERLDGDEVQSFYGETLDDVVRRAEARERGRSGGPKTKGPSR